MHSVRIFRSIYALLFVATLVLLSVTATESSSPGTDLQVARAASKSAHNPFLFPKDVVPPGDSTLALSASVTPASAPIGQAFDFHATVTNTGNETKRFYVDGCPVYYMVDGTYTPLTYCLTIVREIVLEAGQSVTFGPEDEPELHFDPHRFPVGPGEHSAELYISPLGNVSVTFHVNEPTTDLAYAAGRVTRADGSLPLNFGADLVSQDSNGAAAYHATVTLEGYFFFENVRPGTYLLRVGNDAEVWWYPGVLGPDLAKPISLAAGQYAGNLDIMIPGGPIPGPFPLSGQVFEATSESLGTAPLGNAVVMALPLDGTGPDSTEPGTGYPDPYPGNYSAITDANGVFKLDLLQGSYRLIAGKQGYRYQYFNHVYTFGEAAQIPWPNRQVPPRFDLPAQSTNTAVIKGQVLGYNPLADAMPQPLEDATVVAMPLIPSNTTDNTADVLLTHTAADGTFHLEVPSDTPYRVSASKDGYESMYFQNATSNVDATPVDVSPGGTSSGIDFSLPQVLPGFDKGSIQGLVLRRLSETCPDPATGATNDSCLAPAAGALVRITPAYPTLVAVEYQTYAGPDGRFKIDGLLAQADGYLSYYVSAQIENEEPSYYPGGVPFSEAQTLPVLPGQTSDAGNIIVPGKTSQGPGFIAGNITDPENHPIDHALVRVFVDPESPWGFVQRTFTNGDGSFYISDLPAGASVIVSAEASSYVPAYYPGAYQWTLAQRVLVSGPTTPSGPSVRTAPLHMTLNHASTGSFIQAGLVVVAPESVTADTGWVDPTPLANRRIAPASIRARFGKLTYEVGLRDAFFYVVNAAAAGPMELPVAGASTGDNGASILRGLPEGVYIAYADRPGFERAYFTQSSNSPSLITLDDTTPAVLAWIALQPKNGINTGPPPGQDAAMLHNLTNVPNPFGAQTAIRYTLKATSPVTIQVFDHSGRLVRTIVRGNPQVAGPHEVSWDAKDDVGRRATTGVYFARIQAGSEAFGRKMLLLP